MCIPKLFLFSLILWMFSPFASTAQSKPENVTVLIKAYGDRPETGAGIVVGWDKEEEEVYIVTAFHVVDEGSDSIVVNFKKKSMKDYTGKLVRFNEELDVAVIKVNVSGNSIPFAKIQKGGAKDYELYKAVLLIGHPGGAMWVPNANNRIQEVSTDRIITSRAGIDPGYSGGGAFGQRNGQYRILGMIREKDSNYGLVIISIKRIVEEFEKWSVPTNLLITPRRKLLCYYVMAGGAASLAVGLGLKSQSNKFYETYRDNRFTNAAPYLNGMSRDDYFDKANNKNKQAVITQGIGVAALLAGAGLCVREELRRRKEKQRDGISFIPTVDFPSFVESKGKNVQFGLTLKF